VTVVDMDDIIREAKKTSIDIKYSPIGTGSYAVGTISAELHDLMRPESWGALVVAGGFMHPFAVFDVLRSRDTWGEDDRF